MNNNDIPKIISFLKKGHKLLNETSSSLTIMMWDDIVYFYDLKKKIEIKETGHTLFYFETELITDNWEAVWGAKSKYIKWKFKSVFSSWYIAVWFSNKSEMKMDGILSNEIFYIKKGNQIETNIEKMNKIIK